MEQENTKRINALERVVCFAAGGLVASVITVVITLAVLGVID